MAILQLKDWEVQRIWLAEVDIDSGLDFLDPHLERLHFAVKSCKLKYNLKKVESFFWKC